MGSNPTSTAIFGDISLIGKALVSKTSSKSQGCFGSSPNVSARCRKPNWEGIDLEGRE